MTKIIISYRRSDSDVFAGRVRDRIADRYGDNSVFMDVDNIPFGKDFRDHIQEALREADVVLAIVGSRWLGVKGGASRIKDDSSDPVRIELETALSNGLPIIPILIGNTKMPKTEQLPESLKTFSFINAAPVDTGRDFRRDLDRVITTLDTIFKLPGEGTKEKAIDEMFAGLSPTRRRFRVTLGIALGIVGLVGSLIAAVLVYQRVPTRQVTDETTPQLSEYPAFYACGSQSQCMAGRTVCVDNDGDHKFYCKPICENDAQCRPWMTAFPQLRCFEHKRTDGTIFPQRVCNDNASYVR